MNHAAFELARIGQFIAGGNHAYGCGKHRQRQYSRGLRKAEHKNGQRQTVEFVGQDVADAAT